ncbi:ribose-phosphate diphosphokinase [Microbulbifer aggregans]|uniref:ribose-phosphate diphosphokinase n=1 Tax=Microbulbifer aggregans TaxID=1769779 RepID=UPI001CFDD3D0|nr:ribose-phosphate diphosphokinase [Microbulbifer aggregans]
MHRITLFSLEENLPLAPPLQEALKAVAGEIERRRFPDGESYMRVLSRVNGQHCVILADLCQPDEKLLPLQFLADTLRALGAASVGLVAPYLCYMRQDKAFQPGEAITSRVFARSISATVDWLLTVDPHLHRYRSLDDIYTIPAIALSGIPAMQSWLETQPEQLILVGPDAESRQWVARLAGASRHPFIVGEKTRRGDRDVSVTLPADTRLQSHTAVIVDDVISSGHTVLQTIDALNKAGARPIVCAAIHGIFAEHADRKILLAGAKQIATSNSIPGEHCTFDLTSLLAPAIEGLIDQCTSPSSQGDSQP